MEPAGDLRVFFAAQRTMLAWIRTGVALMGFGFVVARFGLFLRELALAQGEAATARGSISMWVGTAMLVIGVVVNVIAAMRYARFSRIFKSDPARLQATGIGPEMVIAGILAAVGVLLAVYLVTSR